ncbi:MAG: conjugal transfer transcriptional regulator TraJ [Nitrospira sp.]
MKANEPKNRKDYQPIKVYCFPDERETIEQQARSTGLSKSSYLLRVGMGYPIRSIVDNHQVEELVKINGDLGRLGGLLKLWLSNGKPAPGIDARTIRETLKKIDRAQDQMLALMQKVLRPQADPISSPGTSPRTSSLKDDDT